MYLLNMAKEIGSTNEFQLGMTKEIGCTNEFQRRAHLGLKTQDGGGIVIL